MKIFLSFCAGSILTSGIIAVIFATTESGNARHLRNEAVSAGVAEWVVSYDSNGSPVLEFKWKQSKQVF